MDWHNVTYKTTHNPRTQYKQHRAVIPTTCTLFSCRRTPPPCAKSKHYYVIPSNSTLTRPGTRCILFTGYNANMAVNEVTHNSSLSVGDIVFFVASTSRFLPLPSITTYIQIRSKWFKMTDIIKCTVEFWYTSLGVRVLHLQLSAAWEDHTYIGYDVTSLLGTGKLHVCDFVQF